MLMTSSKNWNSPCSEKINGYRNPVDVTVEDDQWSHQQQSEMTRGPPLPEENKVRMNSEDGIGQKVRESALNMAIHCTVISNYLADPINYDMRNPTGCKLALNSTLIRYLSGAMSNNSISVR